MNVLGVFPSPQLLEESRREVERERELQRVIRARRAAQRAARPSRLATLTARVRRPIRPVPSPRVAEGC